MKNRKEAKRASDPLYIKPVEKRKIIKVRPFNMANFSGGSGYLVFSLIYQLFALIPATLIIWLVSLVRLPKDENGETDRKRAGKRFYAVSIPFSVILIVVASVFAFENNYGTFAEYWLEVIIISLVPTLGAFFILRRCHREIVNGGNTAVMIFISLAGIIGVVALVFFFCGLILDPIMTEMAGGY